MMEQGMLSLRAERAGGGGEEAGRFMSELAARDERDERARRAEGDRARAMADEMSKLRQALEAYHSQTSRNEGAIAERLQLLQVRVCLSVCLCAFSCAVDYSCMWLTLCAGGCSCSPWRVLCAPTVCVCVHLCAAV